MFGFSPVITRMSYSNRPLASPGENTVVSDGNPRETFKDSLILAKESDACRNLGGSKFLATESGM